MHVCVYIFLMRSEPIFLDRYKIYIYRENWAVYFCSYITREILNTCFYTLLEGITLIYVSVNLMLSFSKNV
jgi:hypothetical protein